MPKKQAAKLRQEKL
jgi:hypothetical protein